jgi:hypothetical protein
MLRRRRSEDAAPAPDPLPDGADGDRRAGNDDSSELARSVLERLEADREWADGRFAEILERLEHLETCLEEADPAKLSVPTAARPRSKEGLSREQVLEIRATKNRSARAARLKAQHEGASGSNGEDSS